MEIREGLDGGAQQQVKELRIGADPRVRTTPAPLVEVELMSAMPMKGAAAEEEKLRRKVALDG